MKWNLIVFTMVILLISCEVEKDFIDHPAQYVSDQYGKVHPDTLLSTQKLPLSWIRKDNAPRYISPKEWESGFYPGALWYLYELSGNDKWQDQAELFLSLIEDQKNNTTTHDLGFMIFCPFGNAYRLTGKEEYKQVIIEASNTLIKRYNEKIGLIQSWDADVRWHFPVIIDNLMNLEMLFWTTKMTGDSTYYKVALNHALNTKKHFFNEDYSNYQIVDFDTSTWEVASKGGYYREKVKSSGVGETMDWARGRGWALYGYTFCYKETGNQDFLNLAEGIASDYMNSPNLPHDKLPNYNLSMPKESAIEKRDASAGAIIASGLFQLSEVTNKDKYALFAKDMVMSLSQPPYRVDPSSDNFFLVNYCNAYHPNKSSVVYGDYYYLEAVVRYMNYFGKDKNGILDD
ncbi:MAG: glycoside hydrolase family 88 protein [Phaeodactylibacter sp.]|uniref:glycoside hydrolase family 88 protein n=1 Tax=Phaeodactylibacter sp. TaxID=1940289 RepID=UPI0032EDD439